MIDLAFSETVEFDTLPLVEEGESKVVRYLGNGLVAIRYKPTIYSFTHNRSGEIPGTEILRLRASSVFLDVIRESGVKHAYEKVFRDRVISKLRLNTKFDAFRPSDCMNVKTIAPIEVICKRRHTGTPMHRYYNADKYPMRNGEFLVKNSQYQETIIRFDWRNPFHNANGERLADEVMPEQMANWFINVRVAKNTASKAFDSLVLFLDSRGIELQDICFLMTTDGTEIVSEISQDCGRFVYKGESLDKDVWRSGGSSDLIVEKWSKILELIEK